ncbi:DUF1398 family protein [Lysinibacter sp. HNR]|uniref:DUF1398 family protein n=1 Tax=Lysinibacter sp. HNR TaxID=3031408 RepID=UPI0024348D66|nr:DUF1398 family protein [Lysinibacter sp. HNR]WGD37609.1 DUF1398 family protein [Lysinibacter sp. HNR]
MSAAINALRLAQERAMKVRPGVGGFPVLAEVLYRAGVYRNEWFLPGAQSLYFTELGVVVQQGEPVIRGLADVPVFDQEELVRVLRRDQAGKTTFPEFLEGAWGAGVVHYIVDFPARIVTYLGSDGQKYVESYPEVSLD